MEITKRIWKGLTRKEKYRIFLISILMVIGAFLEMLGIGMILPIVGVLTNAEYLDRFTFLAKSGLDLSQAQLAMLIMVLFVSLYLFKTVFLIWKSWVQHGLSNSIQARISGSLFSSYLYQPYEFHIAQNSTKLVNVVQSGQSLASEVFTPLLLIISEGLVLLGLLAVLLYVEPVGTIIIIVIFSMYWMIFRILTRTRITRWGQAKFENRETLLRWLQHGLNGIRDVKLAGTEKYLISRHEVELNKNATTERKYLTFQELPRFGLEFLTVLCFCLLVVVMILVGKQISEVLPILSLFAISAFRLLPSLNQVMVSIQQIKFDSHKISSILDVLDLQIEDQPRKERSKGQLNKVELVNISFSYTTSAKMNLTGVNLEVKTGEFIGIIGPSGSGKSTILDILVGLLKPTIGNVMVDGEDIFDHLRGWQDQIGYVPQTVFLIDDSIRSNITFASSMDEIDHAEIDYAIEASNLKEFILGLPDGLDTLVGERGVRLSGGQRQRIGIARSLYRNPKVLILDEATSSLDEETEREVMDSVRNLRGDCTVVIVTHRMSTVGYCDRLYKVENGSLFNLDESELSIRE